MELYRPMLKQALSITWRFKYLWFFGLFAALIGNGGAFNYGIKNFGKVESQGVWLTNLKELVKDFKFEMGGFDLSAILSDVNLAGVFVFIVVLLVGIFFLWLSVTSQGALVYGIKQGVKNRGGLFNEAVKTGMTVFWPLLILNILLSVSIFVLLAVLNLPFVILFLYNADNALWQSIIILLSFIIWVPVTVIFYLVAQYAMIYIVNQGKHIGEAIKLAWKLFVKNWVVSLETGLLLLLLNFVTSILLVIAMVILALPFVMLAAIVGSVGSGLFLWVVIGLAILCFITLLFLYGAMWNVFQVSVWILLFEQISGGVVYSKVLRFAANLIGGAKQKE